MKGFSDWLEAHDDVVQQLAQTSQTNRLNESGISYFAKVMMNDVVMKMLLDELNSGNGMPRVMYHAPISNNLIQAEDERLKKAKGIIDPNQMPQFAFFMKEELAGSMLIRFPPVTFEEYDKSLLKNIIRHESVHADDWIKPEFKDVEPSGQHVWNPSKYAKNKYEARAMVIQLAGLLSDLGDVEKVIRALTVGSGEFVINRRFLPIIREYLRTHVQPKESVMKWLAPIAMSAGLTSGDVLPTIPGKVITPGVRKEARTERAAQFVREIYQRMLFRNFVVKE